MLLSELLNKSTKIVEPEKDSNGNLTAKGRQDEVFNKYRSIGLEPKSKNDINIESLILKNSVNQDKKSSLVGEDFENNSKYDDYVRENYWRKDIEGLSIDNLRGEDQSGAAKIGLGTVKMVGKAATAFVGGVLDIPVGFVTGISRMIDAPDGEMMSSFASGFSHNIMTETIESINDSMEDTFKVYGTKLDENAPWYNRLGSAYTWSNLIDNTGFTIGSAAAAFLTGGAATGAIGFKMAKFMMKSGLTKGGVGLVKRGFSGLLMATPEAASEAERARIDFMREQGDKYLKEYHENERLILENKGLTDDEKREYLKKEYEDYIKNKTIANREAQKSANIVYGINLAVLTFTDATTFGNSLLTGGFGSSSRGIYGILGRTERTLSDKIAKDKITGSLKVVGNKKLDAGMAAGKVLFVEPNEEMVQHGATETGNRIARSVIDLYDKGTYDIDAIESTAYSLSNIGSEFMKANKEYYSDIDNYEEAFSALVSVICPLPYVGRMKNGKVGVRFMSPVFSAIRTSNNEYAEAEQVVKSLNSFVSKENMDKLKGTVANLTRNEYLAQNVREAILKNDKFSANLNNEAKIINALTYAIASGQYEYVMDALSETFDFKDENSNMEASKAWETAQRKSILNEDEIEDIRNRLAVLDARMQELKEKEQKGGLTKDEIEEAERINKDIKDLNEAVITYSNEMGSVMIDKEGNESNQKWREIEWYDEDGNKKTKTWNKMDAQERKEYAQYKKNETIKLVDKIAKTITAYDEATGGAYSNEELAELAYYSVLKSSVHESAEKLKKDIYNKINELKEQYKNSEKDKKELEKEMNSLEAEQRKINRKLKRANRMFDKAEKKLEGLRRRASVDDLKHKNKLNGLTEMSSKSIDEIELFVKKKIYEVLSKEYKEHLIGEFEEGIYDNVNSIWNNYKRTLIEIEGMLLGADIYSESDSKGVINKIIEAANSIENFDDEDLYAIQLSNDKKYNEKHDKARNEYEFAKKEKEWYGNKKNENDNDINSKNKEIEQKNEEIKKKNKLDGRLKEISDKFSELIESTNEKEMYDLIDDIAKMYNDKFGFYIDYLFSHAEEEFYNEQTDKNESIMLMDKNSRISKMIHDINNYRNIRDILARKEKIYFNERKKMQYYHDKRKAFDTAVDAEYNKIKFKLSKSKSFRDVASIFVGYDEKMVDAISMRSIADMSLSREVRSYINDAYGIYSSSKSIETFLNDYIYKYKKEKEASGKELNLNTTQDNAYFDSIFEFISYLKTLSSFENENVENFEDYMKKAVELAKNHNIELFDLSSTSIEKVSIYDIPLVKYFIEHDYRISQDEINKVEEKIMTIKGYNPKTKIYRDAILDKLKISDPNSKLYKFMYSVIKTAISQGSVDFRIKDKGKFTEDKSKVKADDDDGISTIIETILTNISVFSSITEDQIDEFIENNKNKEGFVKELLNRGKSSYNEEDQKKYLKEIKKLSDSIIKEIENFLNDNNKNDFNLLNYIQKILNTKLAINSSNNKNFLKIADLSNNKPVKATLYNICGELYNGILKSADDVEEASTEIIEDPTTKYNALELENNSLGDEIDKIKITDDALKEYDGSKPLMLMSMYGEYDKDGKPYVVSDPVQLFNESTKGITDYNSYKNKYNEKRIREKIENKQLKIAIISKNGTERVVLYDVLDNIVLEELGLCVDVTDENRELVKEAFSKYKEYVKRNGTLIEKDGSNGFKITHIIDIDESAGNIIAEGSFKIQNEKQVIDDSELSKIQLEISDGLLSYKNSLGQDVYMSNGYIADIIFDALTDNGEKGEFAKKYITEIFNTLIKLSGSESNRGNGNIIWKLMYCKGYSIKFSKSKEGFTLKDSNGISLEIKHDDFKDLLDGNGAFDFDKFKSIYSSEYNIGKSIEYPAGFKINKQIVTKVDELLNIINDFKIQVSKSELGQPRTKEKIKHGYIYTRALSKRRVNGGVYIINEENVKAEPGNSEISIDDFIEKIGNILSEKDITIDDEFKEIINNWFTNKKTEDPDFKITKGFLNDVLDSGIIEIEISLQNGNGLTELEMILNKYINKCK